MEIRLSNLLEDEKRELEKRKQESSHEEDRNKFINACFELDDGSQCVNLVGKYEHRTYQLSQQKLSGSQQKVLGSSYSKAVYEYQNSLIEKSKEIILNLYDSGYLDTWFEYKSSLLSYSYSPLRSIFTVQVYPSREGQKNIDQMNSAYEELNSLIDINKDVLDRVELDYLRITQGEGFLTKRKIRKKQAKQFIEHLHLLAQARKELDEAVEERIVVVNEEEQTTTKLQVEQEQVSAEA